MSWFRTDGRRAAAALAATAALATGLAAGLAGCGGSDDEDASVSIVARFAGPDGQNGASYADARSKLATAGITPRSARCVHRLAQGGEVLGDNWAGDPPVWVVVEIGGKQRAAALALNLGFADFDPKATGVWAPFQGNVASCPATAG